MKNLIIILLIIGSVNVSYSQIDRSKKPAPAPAKEIKIGDYEKFTLKNGLTVIVVENHKLPRVAYSLSLDREPLLEKDKVGYLSMVGQLMSSGTASRTKAQLDEEVDFIGASLFATSSSLFASSLTKHQDKLLELMTDVLYNPSFPQEELDKIKKQTISGIKAGEEDPSAISGNVRSRILYGDNHPYGEIQTEEAVGNITVDDIKAYYETYFKPNIAYLAIVGDISVKEAKKIAKEKFGNWERGEVPAPTYDQPSAPGSNIVAVVNRSNAVQTDLNVTYPIDVKPGTMEYIQARVMNQVLGGSSASRLFKNIRGDKGFTYGAYSSVSPDELIGTFNASAAVRTEVTDSSVTEFIYEMNRIRTEQVDEKELQLAKNVLIGGFGRSLERPQTVANYAVNIERRSMDPNYYNNYVKNIQSVTAEDVMNAAQKFIKPENAYIVAVGKAGEIADKLAQFGEVKHYDTYGNEVDPALAAIPDGLTAQKVFESYIEAVGGKDKIAGIKTLKMSMSSSMMGQTLSMQAVKAAPNKSLTEVKMSGNVVNKIVFDGEKGKMSGMQGVQDVTGDQALDMAVSSAIIEELVYLEGAVEVALSGVEQINGKDAYGVEVTMPSGKSSVRYYDADSGLLVRVTNTMETPQGAMTLSSDFGDYKDFGGVLFPTSLTQPLNPQMKMEITVNEIVVNEEVAEGTFTVE